MSAVDPHLLQKGPLAGAHAPAGRLLRRAEAWQDWARARQFTGERQFGWPLLALNAKRELGRVRHALSQRVVAGTMIVTPPIQIRTDHRLSMDGDPTGSLQTNTGAD